MNLKQKVLDYFYNNQGYNSGQIMADRLDVSRTAIWKVVNLLREEGYKIDSSNRGYLFLNSRDIINLSGISKELSSPEDYHIKVFDSVDSTNNFLKKEVINSKEKLIAIVSNHQSSGRGRRGKIFFSPKGSGLYMSILLPTNMNALDTKYITCMSAVCVSEIIEEMSSKKTDIKWVNDIYIEGKKVSGILCEANFNLENNLVDNIIVGIGINIYEPKSKFPEEIKKTAGSIFKEKSIDLRNKIAGKIIEKLYFYYINKTKEEIYAEYKKRSFIIGREIIVKRKDSNYNAIAVDLNSDFNLLVKKQNEKELITLSSGEISIGVKNGKN